MPRSIFQICGRAFERVVAAPIAGMFDEPDHESLSREIQREASIGPRRRTGAVRDQDECLTRASFVTRDRDHVRTEPYILRRRVTWIEEVHRNAHVLDFVDRLEEQVPGHATD